MKRLLLIPAVLALASCAETADFLAEPLQAPPGWTPTDREIVLPVEGGAELALAVPGDEEFTGTDVVADTAEGVALAVTGDQATAAGIGAGVALLGALIAGRRKKNQPAT